MAAAVAEEIAGSEWRFAQKMTEKARALGMSRTAFRNASGLPNTKQVTTAKDMATPSGALVSADIDHVVQMADVVIDFSLFEATEQVAAAVVRHRRPLVCGVSGLGEAQIEALERAGESVAVVYDRNMSQGIAVLQMLKLLEPFDIAALAPASPEAIHLVAEAGRISGLSRTKTSSPCAT